MNRKDFFKYLCKYGVCSCAAVSCLTVLNANANVLSEHEDDQDWRIGFMQKRFAKLIEVLDSKLGESEKQEILELLGRECAKEGMAELLRLKGNISGFLSEIQNKWVEKAEYDEEKGEIRILDKKREVCFCPFVDQSLISKDFCNCSLGWQKETYETILDRKVDVVIESSILRGDERCSFTIKLI